MLTMNKGSKVIFTENKGETINELPRSKQRGIRP